MTNCFLLGVEKINNKEKADGAYGGDTRDLRVTVSLNGRGNAAR